MPADIATIHLADIVRTFRNYRTLGERAMAQIPDEDLHRLLDADSNSIALIAKHVGGNLRSRFRDFLTSDGEKADRHRDTEFEVDRVPTRADVMQWWDAGWSIAMETLESLRPEDLERTVTIRNEPFVVVEALNRAAAHVAYHVGQIVFLAKHFAGPQWTSLSIPKGKSAQHAQGTFKQGIVPPPADPAR